MAKNLLSLLLVMTQLLSWSTQAVYLCVDSDGSICLDGGPDACDCCHHDDHDCDHHGCSQHHDPVLVASCATQPAGQWEATESDCNCWHIQILSQQQPTNHRPATSGDSTH